MRKYNALYYLLFILLITGAFASMAQNTYGMKIIGIVAFVFGFAFFIEFIAAFKRKENNKLLVVAEPACLSIIAIIFGLRIFYIHFPSIEWMFAIATTVLVFIYARRMVEAYGYYAPQSKMLGILMFVYYLCIILFLSSLAIVPFVPDAAEAAGIAAFLLMLVFIAGALINRSTLLEGIKVSAFSVVRHSKDFSIIIVSVFLLLALYTGLNRFGIIPPVYSDQYPKAYYDLVNAANRKEKDVNGRYKHEVFMDNYKLFLKRVKTGE